MIIYTFFNSLAQIVFLLVAGSTVLNWVRRRDQTRRDIALVFIALAVCFIAFGLTSAAPEQSGLYGLIFFVAFVAEPYLLLRMARYFRPLPKLARRAALIGLLAAYGSFLFAGTATVVVIIVLIGYFVIVESYASILLIQGALTVAGITGKRLKLASAGSGLLALVFLLALALGFVASANVISESTGFLLASGVLMVAVLSGLSYYFGFAPPRWLTRTWQLGELHRYLRETSGEVTYERTVTFNQLSVAAMRTVGGAAAGVAGWNSAEQHLTLALGGNPPWRTADLETDPGIIGQAWRDRQPRAARVPKEVSPQVVSWAEQYGIKTLFIVPILGTRQAWGLLIVALPHDPLFVNDDLDVLALLASQTAAMLDSTAFVEELQIVNQSLENRVAERTVELSRANRALRTISDCNQVLVRSKSEADLLSQVCQIIVATGGYEMAWVGYPENDAAKSVRPMAQAGMVEGFLELVSPSWSGAENGRAPLGTAIRTGKTQQVHVAAADQYPVWRAAALQRGYAACIALPFVVDGSVLGAVGIFAGEPQAFDEDEVRLLTELADDLAFGIVALRTQAAHDRAEASLRASEERFAQAFRASPAALTITRMADSRFIDVNESFLSLFGYGREEVIGSRSTDLYININPDERAELVRQLGEQGSVRNFEIMLRTKSGDALNMLLSAETMELDGQAHTLTTILDITNRKRAEAQLRATLTKLEINNRELQDFAYVASHDLQEPLRKIQAFSDRLQKQAGALSEEQKRDYLDRMQSAAGRMQNLINDLLTFSRVTTKAKPFAMTALSDVAKDALSDLEVVIERTGGQVEVGPLPTIEADPTQMRQVLQNLLGNALKFHKPGVPPIVRLYSNKKDEYCELLITDNGIGFDEKYLDRIFTPFQRLHGRNNYEGTGIGLAVVRKIVDRHGGQVTAQSQPDVGTTFIVTLPIKHSPETLSAFTVDTRASTLDLNNAD